MSAIIEELDINEDVADLAEAILKVAELGTQLNASKLHRRTVVLILKDITGLPHGQINAVLDAIPRLTGYVKP